MLPARFDYQRPETLEEALSLLDRYGEDGKVLAGGQSLIPLMTLRFASPAYLVDINRIPGRGDIREAGGKLVLGALARHNEIADSDVITARYPLVASAAPQISDPIVRNLGTVGGSLSHADPAGDWGSVMLALGAEVVVRSSSGDRTLVIDDFLRDTFTTDLRPNELLVEVRVPAPSPHSGGAYLKLERKVGDFATVGVAVQLALNDGHVATAGMGLTAVGPKNLRARDAEESLAGAEPGDAAFAKAARLAGQAAQPMSDLRGSAEYK